MTDIQKHRNVQLEDRSIPNIFCKEYQRQEGILIKLIHLGNKHCSKIKIHCSKIKKSLNRKKKRNHLVLMWHMLSYFSNGLYTHYHWPLSHVSCSVYVTWKCRAFDMKLWFLYFLRTFAIQFTVLWYNLSKCLGCFPHCTQNRSFWKWFAFDE